MKKENPLNNDTFKQHSVLTELSRCIYRETQAEKVHMRAYKDIDDCCLKKYQNNIFLQKVKSLFFLYQSKILCNGNRDTNYSTT